MKKHLFKSFFLLSIVLTFSFFNSCAEHVDGDPNVISQAQSQGNIELKILSGHETGKVIKSSGSGAVIGTKRTSNNTFMVYQIVGTFQNVGFGCQVTNENGEESFGDLAIYFNTGVSDIYTSIEDASNNVKVTNIKLTQSQGADAQLMNGKAVFKGKFIKENMTGSGSDEEEILVEGTINF
ncbi:MAG: hypothetical protein RSF68_02960 [Myroides sp.]